MPAVVSSKRPFLPIWWLAFFILCLFVGLRHEVGGDWHGYLIITERIEFLPFFQAIFHQELLFSLFTWISTMLGAGVYGINLFGAIIFFIGLFFYCYRQPSPWLALAVAFPFLIVVAVMSANRQGIAIGVYFFALAMWSSLSPLARVYFIMFASLFHTSAILLLSFVVWDLNIPRWKKIGMLAPILAVGMIFLMQSGSALDRYTEIYLEVQPEGVYAPGAIFHLLFNLIPAVLFLSTKNKWRYILPNYYFIYQLSLISIILLFLAPFFSVAVSRVSLYLFPVSISVLSSAPLIFKGLSYRLLIRIIIVSLLFFSILIWMNFANTAFTYIPYDNLIFRALGV